MVVLLLVSCTDFFDMGQEQVISFSDPSRPSSTRIKFNNDNNCVVDIYGTPSRGEIIASASPYGSAVRSWLPTNDAFVFYLTYHFKIEGISIPYTPTSQEISIVTSTIPRDQETTIQLPNLSQAIPANVPLFTEPYILITNNYGSTTTASFINGTTVMMPVGGSSSSTSGGYINRGESALYKISPGTNISMCSIMVLADQKPLTSAITAFQGGYLQRVTITSTGTLMQTGTPTPLTLSNIGYN